MTKLEIVVKLEQKPVSMAEMKNMANAWSPTDGSGSTPGSLPPSSDNTIEPYKYSFRIKIYFIIEKI